MARCENVGVCDWCGKEVADNHLGEPMCGIVDSLIELEQLRKEALHDHVA